MGDRHEPRSPLAWQGTLGEMDAHGTRLAQTCNGPSCRTFTTLDVSEMIAQHVKPSAAVQMLVGGMGHIHGDPAIKILDPREVSAGQGVISAFGEALPVAIRQACDPFSMSRTPQRLTLLRCHLLAKR